MGAGDRTGGAGMTFYASHESVELYTPRYIWERAIRCMGGIDCDPSSDPGRHIPAAIHFTKKENGLTREWHGRIWMNPPFPPGEFFDKLEREWQAGHISEAVVLWKAATETEAWRKITRIAVLIAFPHHRIEFLNGTTAGGKGSTFSPALFYVGNNPDRFIESFSDIADIWKPIVQVSKIPRGQLRILDEPARVESEPVNFPLEREWGKA